ncbi:MAG: helix-turn-helix transcriptional regulator [Prolixibacteraceae bacterium]|nr:helix-turn-helix transcriptional regulator [Prolixibacteraceae bacterium]
MIDISQYIICMGRYSINKIPQEVLNEIAVKHRQLRKAKKISQIELAERSGVSLGSIKRFEQTGKIAFESLLKLAHLLDRLDDFEGIFATKNTDAIEKLFRSN